MAWSDAARKAAAQARRMKVRFSAVTANGKRFRKVFNVKAHDNYTAMDAIAAKLGKKYESMHSRVFKFGAPKLVMNKKLAKIIKNAGPEED